MIEKEKGGFGLPLKGEESEDWVAARICWNGGFESWKQKGNGNGEMDES